MNAVVPMRSLDFSNNQLALIRKTVAADTNQDEFELFVHTAKHLRLDPLRRQIYAFVFSKDKPDKRRMSIIVAIDGFRAIADRTGCYRPDEDEPTFEIDPALKSATNLIGLVKATVRVWKHSHGDWHKVTASAYWDEYAPIKDEWGEGEDGRRRKTGKQALDQTGNWPKMPRLMLAKVAEALALRKAWPDDFSNVYAAEEVDRSRAQDMTAWEAADAGATEKRLAQIGQGQTILFQFDPTGPLEPVPLGKIADRVAEFVQNNRDEVSAIGLFESRNRHALRDFWARQPGDALDVKRMLEGAMAPAGAA
ncbi:MULTISPECIES: phage recombination protein Bet [unclassified Bosea (in: a-proteobacteria)]|uniref:phage recombination protein Bet n=1 Tax=unclassified Bosea (in: a-proteobacteria) TaxID=2653178 RepID=UPI000F75D3C6|nr:MULTISPECIES: phage recombination protein Bet [unclassified Bosea (in: a-proteobacteria)]AZO77520.1 phage recombination protein Bet [Bosea sp. Tri-49]RXT18128.1 phage recombination protein Bet [Bosea sp. Tri-39]RXT32725.1 phage recombination protein Bet [Bosea sp. Tri-54]